MMLSGCALLPGARMPLYIFEPRYRKMVADALAGERMFCVGTIDERETADPDSPVVFPDSTAGMIRACVENEDGTSHLVLEGLQRLRFMEWLPGKPYRVARVRSIDSESGDDDERGALCDQVKYLAEQKIATSEMDIESNTLLDLWVDLGSEEAIADFVAYHLIPDVVRRQPLVGMRSVTERLAFVKDCLTL